jgi:addiction module RelE/StbE family toxin
MPFLVYTQYFKKKLQKITKRDKRMEEKIKRKLLLLKENPRYPSLKTHKLGGTMAETWSSKIEEDMIVVYAWKRSRAILLDIGTHDEVYE